MNSMARDRPLCQSSRAENHDGNPNEKGRQDRGHICEAKRPPDAQPAQPPNTAEEPASGASGLIVEPPSAAGKWYTFH